MCDQVTWACGVVVFLSNLDVFYERFRKVCPQCNTVVHAIDGALLLGSMRTQWNVEKPCCLRKSYNLVRDKARKVSKRASETREQTLHMQARTEPNTFDKHKHLSSSLRWVFCTSVLFIHIWSNVQFRLWWEHVCMLYTVGTRGIFKARISLLWHQKTWTVFWAGREADSPHQK